MLKLTKKEKVIVFSDFPDDGEEIEFDRDTLEKYSQNARCVKIATGRWYTPKEMKERARKAFSVKI